MRDELLGHANIGVRLPAPSTSLEDVFWLTDGNVLAQRKYWQGTPDQVHAWNSAEVKVWMKERVRPERLFETIQKIEKSLAVPSDLPSGELLPFLVDMDHPDTMNHPIIAAVLRFGDAAKLLNRRYVDALRGLAWRGLPDPLTPAYGFSERGLEALVMPLRPTGTGALVAHVLAWKKGLAGTEASP